MDAQHRQDLESNLSALRRVLAERFDEGELRDLSFDLNVDYDSLPASGKAGKARELVAFLERRNRIPDLIEIGRRIRPDVPWDDLLPGPIAPIEFVNREQELDMLNVERLRASRSPYVLITAPAGYGKSYLLQGLINIIRSDEDLSNEWRYRYVDFGQLPQEQPSSADYIGYAVRAITGEAVQVDPDTAIEVARDHIVQVLVAPSADGRRALLLMLDSVERLDEETRSWLYTLLRELRRRTRVGHQEIITVRVVIAGRDVESFWEGYESAYPKPPAPQRISLSPFDEHPIQTLIWNRAEAVEIPLDDQTVIQIADEVHYLSGGHPRVIRDLVDDLARQSFAIGPVAEYFEECRARLVQTYLSPVADELAESVEPEIGAAVQTLSVFRRVNANTLQALMAAGELPDTINEVKLLGDMQRAHLLNGPVIREPFYRDHLMRRIWALDLAHRSPESQARYQRLNKIALDLYSAWIHNWGPGLPDSPLKAMQQLFSVIEWLFHALQDVKMDEEELRFDLGEHIRALSAGGPPLSVAELIVDEIKRDPEVCYLLGHRLGKDGVSRVSNWMYAS